VELPNGFNRYPSPRPTNIREVGLILAPSAERPVRDSIPEEILAIRWPKSRIVRGSLGEEIDRLKSLSGKNIVVGGGPRLAQSFLERELADELYITMYPSIVGRGKPFFRVVSNPDHGEDVVPLGAPGRHDFKLIEALPQKRSILLHYARASS
jgi:riboflavin biosynthesis pyrimidine reductase